MKIFKMFKDVTFLGLLVTSFIVLTLSYAIFSLVNITNSDTSHNRKLYKAWCKAYDEPKLTLEEWHTLRINGLLHGQTTKEDE